MTEKLKTARDKIREVALATNRKTKVIDAFGSKVEIRQPSLKIILASASDEHKQHSLAYMMLHTVFVPVTGESVFEEADIDNLMEGAFDLDKQNISKVLTDFSGIKVTEAKKG